MVNIAEFRIKIAKNIDFLSACAIVYYDMWPNVRKTDGSLKKTIDKGEQTDEGEYFNQLKKYRGRI